MDQLNATLCIDNFMTEELKHLAPYKSTFDLESPYHVSPNLSMPKPVVASISNMVHNPKSMQNLDPAKLAWTASLAQAY
jgi:hypothetical protein